MYIPIFDDQSFNDTLTDDTVSFKQLGPDLYYFNACSGEGLSSGAFFNQKSKDIFLISPSKLLVVLLIRAGKTILKNTHNI